MRGKMANREDRTVVKYKLEESYTLRIPSITKKYIDQLPKKLKKQLNEEILVVMARVIHQSKFNPLDYLSSKIEKELRDQDQNEKG